MPVCASGCPARDGGTRTSNSLTPSPSITVASPLTSDMMLSTPERRVAEHEIGAGAVDRLDVALVRDAAHDPEAGIELAADTRRDRCSWHRRWWSAAPTPRGRCRPVRSSPDPRRRPRRPRPPRGARASSAFSSRSSDVHLSAFCFSARAAACPTLPAPITSTGAVVPSRAIRALSARICAAEPATTATASARISVCGNAGLQPAALPQPDHAQAGQLAQARIAHERSRQERVA